LSSIFYSLKSQNPSKGQKLKIIVGIPAFNEEKNIAAIITKLADITDTIIVCNDGSSDLTLDIAEKMGQLS